MQTDSKLWCANGRTGYDTETGKPYTVKGPCKNYARPGHIYCDKCRAASGGLPLSVSAPSAGHRSGNEPAGIHSVG